jgi:ribosome maturation factor RimP
MANVADIETIARPVLDRHGCDLVLATFRRERAGWVLRVLVEKVGADPETGSGVDVELCAAISRDLGAVLDVEDAIDRAYTMEVSSPGIERPLTRENDYRRFAGRAAAIKTNTAIDGRRRFKGVLKGMTAAGVVLETTDSEAVTIPAELIDRANLVFETNELGKKPGVK